MYRILLAIVAILMLGACTASGPDFKRMSDYELATYNAIASTEEIVYCFEEVRTGSHIKKKHCSTLAEIRDALYDTAASLDAMHQGSNGILSSRGGVGYNR